jgi:hypothetical protein
MMLFASWIKHPFNVPVQRPRHADPREHRQAAEIHHKQQAFHCRLPFRGGMLGLRQFSDVERGIAEPYQRLALGRIDRVETVDPMAIGSTCARSLVLLSHLAKMIIYLLLAFLDRMFLCRQLSRGRQ